jgi:hypothetical protein
MAEPLPFRAARPLVAREAASIKAWFTFVHQNDEEKIYNKRKNHA